MNAIKFDTKTNSPDIHFFEWDLEKSNDACKEHFWDEVKERVIITQTKFKNFNRNTEPQKEKELLSFIREQAKQMSPKLFMFNERLLRLIDCEFNFGRPDIPKILEINDYHIFDKGNETYKGVCNLIKLKKFIKKEDIKLIIVTSGNAVDYFKDLIEHPIIYLPKYAKVGFFKTQNREKKYDVVGCGSGYEKYSHIYPLRTYIHKNMPSDINYFKPKFGEYIKEDYAQLLDESKIFIFGTSIYKMPLQKCFEGRASSSLVMCNETKDDEMLGFKDGIDFVKINKDNFIDKIRYYLENEDERLKIVKNANKLIEEKHSIKIRVGEFLAILDRYLY